MKSLFLKVSSFVNANQLVAGKESAQDFKHGKMFVFSLKLLGSVE
jgi:hypothetical protein